MDTLDDTRSDAYTEFLLSMPTTLLYASDRYRRLLKAYLGAEDRYLLALDGHDRIVGALPVFLKRNRRLGNVLNSLPFFGSNGGIITHANPEAKRRLIDAWHALTEKEQCISATLITSPFEPDMDFYKQHTHYSYLDRRIGQLTRLPELPAAEDLERRLMGIFQDPRPRNIRKALKNGIAVTAECGKDNLDFLMATHKENMKVIGGTPKDESFFRLIPEIFRYGEDFLVYTAYRGSEPVAALLLFYFNKTVEYFTPVIKENYRTFQPLSLIIFEAMKDAVARGYQWWNWGGTWLSQDGVYDFKKKWGAEDMPYFYYTRADEEWLLHRTQEELKEEYPCFFTVPFRALQP
ncbi:MAG: GNAT family N-acetyltransferase [Nitrospirae bacterium]|nr:GNAT family N-acetyltransferase [Nitrospirota bacterium]